MMSRVTVLGDVSLRRVSPVRFIPPALRAPPWLLGGRRCQSLPSTSSLNRLLALREHGSTQGPWRSAAEPSRCLLCPWAARRLDRFPQLRRRVRHIEMVNAQGGKRVHHGVGDRRWRAVAAGLAHPLDTERMEGIRRHRLAQDERRHLAGARHRVIQQRGGERLAVVAGSLFATLKICADADDGRSPPLRGRCPAGQRGAT